MQIADPNHHVKHIYQLIGKEPFTPTTLKDLKVAAEKLGFAAAGYKLTADQLKTINTYVVLPVGDTAGTPKDPLHFILLKEVKGDSATVVDTTNLEHIDIPFADLQRIWTGYALLLAPDRDVSLFHERTETTASLPKHEPEDFDGFKDFEAVDSGSMLEHTFTMRNETAQHCKLRIVSRSCSCVSPELGKAELRPNEGTSLKLALHVDKPGWSLATVAVALEPAGIIKRYLVKAYGKDSFHIAPQIGHVAAPDAGRIEYPVRITYYTDSNDLVSFDHMKSEIDGLVVGTVATENTKREQYVEYRFKVPVVYEAGEPADTVRTIQDQVQFVLNTQKGKRFIPFSLTIKVGSEKFRLTPEKVFIIASKSGRPVQKKAKLEFLIDEPPAHIAAKSDPALPIETKTTRVSKNSYMIEITLNREKLRGLSAGMHKGQILIVPQGAASLAKIAIPISLFVRE
jgi:hypothetical protein